MGNCTYLAMFCRRPSTATSEKSERLSTVHSDDIQKLKRLSDASTRTLYLYEALESGQQAFQLTTQLALTEACRDIDGVIAVLPFDTDFAAHRLARIDLADYFASALVLPNGEFLQAVASLRYDIDLLGQRFGIGFKAE